ncbi:MAG: hypothetical protein F4X14_18460 [Caldilineaceae bacterium SB0661_bin_32]|uniref:Uncharacterized protein n=1 Tax=Caldilineaceae bacterium SB0661_bin_32 TaxID=2605255 RepID=A0A6B1DD23_9CHLR|nr:hypothetical protein [Caldilineaceae bacterium SB0661_bin_32]
MTAVKAIMEGTDPRCHTSSCRDGRCTLSMENAPKPMALINLEHEAASVDPDAPRSDFLFVGGRTPDAEWVSPIELTAGSARVSKFLPQLRAGAEIASKLIPRHIQVRFRPVAAYGGELRRSERDNFLKKANYVTFRNNTTQVKLIRCGSPLSKALSD